MLRWLRQTRAVPTPIRWAALAAFALGSVAVAEAALSTSDLKQKPAAAAALSTGGLKQKPGAAGCVSIRGTRPCADVNTLPAGAAVTVSPDGRNAYAASEFDEAVVVFDRAANGSLTQKPGTAGCVSSDGRDGGHRRCAKGRALSQPSAVTVSPDGASVYVASDEPDADEGDKLAVFDRAADGRLLQKPGPAGCVAYEAHGGCAEMMGVDGPLSIVVSPDGRSLYVAAYVNGAVGVFDRAADGTLTQKPLPAGCIFSAPAEADTDSCASVRGLRSAYAVTASPDGRSVYVAAQDGVVVFDRAADGRLAQKLGAAGCITDGGRGGCARGRALKGAVSVTLSTDGASVYVASIDSGAVAIFDRGADGRLTQKRGSAGCASDGGRPHCAIAKALDGAFSVAASTDGASVYVASLDSDAVAVFDRAGGGALTQKRGTAGCVSNTGAGPCFDGRALPRPDSVAVSGDARNVYVGSKYGGVTVFDRVPAAVAQPNP